MNKFKKDKIGILGGSFDPPHIGHLLISKLAKKKFKMSKIIWLITKKNPLKKKAYFSLLDRKKRCSQLLKNERFISAKFIEDKVKSNKLISS
jgi:nicotinate-nucleotide adenylyltransferase